MPETTAVERFWSGNPKPAQLCLLEAAFDNSIETVLFLRSVDRRWREMATDLMLARFKHTKLAPVKRSARTHKELIVPPELSDGGYVVIQQTGFCGEDGLHMPNECRYPLGDEGIAAANAGDLPTMKLRFKSYDAQTGLCTFTPICATEFAPALRMRGRASVDDKKAMMLDDISYNSLWFKPAPEDAEDPSRPRLTSSGQEIYSDDYYYPRGQTPKVLYGLEIAVPLRKGWSLNTGPALITDMPPLPDPLEVLEAIVNDDLKGIETAIQDEKLGYPGWKWTGTTSNFGLPPPGFDDVDLDPYDIGMTDVEGELNIASMKIPLLSVSWPLTIAHARRDLFVAPRRQSTRW